MLQAIISIYVSICKRALLFFYYLAMNDFVSGKVPLAVEGPAALLANVIAFTLPDPLQLKLTTSVNQKKNYDNEHNKNKRTFKQFLFQINYTTKEYFFGPI